MWCRMLNKKCLSILLASMSFMVLQGVSYEREILEYAKNGQKESVEIVKSYIQDNLNIDFTWKDPNGNTALYYAALNNNIDLLNLLLPYCDINAQNNLGQTPLFAAAGAGNKEIVEVLVANFADANITDVAGNNALMVACAFGKTNVVPLLIPKTLNIDAENQNGDTALILLISIGIFDIIPLLEAGADGAINKFSNKIRSQIGLENYMIILEIILNWTLNDNKKKIAKLFVIAARDGDITRVSNFLKNYEIDINYIDSNKDGSNECTALLEAVRNRHYGLVALLLKNDANPRPKFKISEDSALSIAVDRMDFNMVKLLLDLGVDSCSLTYNQFDDLTRYAWSFQYSLPEEIERSIKTVQAAEFVQKHRDILDLIISRQNSHKSTDKQVITEEKKEKEEKKHQ